MFWTKDEREAFWKRNQIGFAELAHEYLCCDVPTVTACALCDKKPEECKNKAEIEKAIINFTYTKKEK